MQLTLSTLWNNGQEISHDVQRHAMLVGSATAGPGFIPVLASSQAQVDHVFGAGSPLASEYSEFLSAGGGRAWLMRVDATNYAISIGGHLVLTSLSGLSGSDDFTAAWATDVNGAGYLVVTVEDTSYDIPLPSSKESLARTINGRAACGVYPFFASSWDTTPLQESDFYGIMSYGIDTPFDPSDPLVYAEQRATDLVEDTGSIVLGFCCLPFPYSDTTRHDVYTTITSALETRTESGRTPSIVVLPCGESTSDVEDFLASLIEESEPETFDPQPQGATITLRHGSIVSLVLEDGQNVLVADRDYSLDEGLGIISVLTDITEPIATYTYATLPTPAFLHLVVHSSSDTEGTRLSTGTGALCGALMKAGSDRQVTGMEFQPTGTLWTVDEDTLNRLSGKGLILARQTTSGRMRFDCGAAIISAVDPDSPYAESMDAMLLHDLVDDMKDLLEKHLMEPGIPAFDVSIPRILAKYDEQLVDYAWNWTRTRTGTDLEYTINLEVQVAGAAQSVRMAISL